MGGPLRASPCWDGFAQRHKIVADGARQIVGLYCAGQLIDLNNMMLRVTDETVQTLSVAQVAAIPAAALTALTSRFPAIAEALLREGLIEAAIFAEWIANVGRRGARARIAHLLCEIALRQQDAATAVPGRFHLPMTQEQIGDATGLTSVHVNRVLRQLDAEGVIRRDRRSVTVGDWDALVAAAGFSPDYLHLDETPPARLMIA